MDNYIKQEDEALLKSIDVFRALMADNNLILDNLVNMAKDEVRSYLSKRYNLEPYFESVKESPALKNIVLTIVIYYGYRRVVVNKIPENVISAYKDVITYLKGLNRGDLQLNIDPLINDDEGSSYFVGGSSNNFYN